MFSTANGTMLFQKKQTNKQYKNVCMACENFTRRQHMRSIADAYFKREEKATDEFIAICMN